MSAKEQDVDNEGIAAGHRIDHVVDVNEMGDCEILDYPEDYTSPNCKKFDEHTDTATIMGTLGDFVEGLEQALKGCQE